MKNVIAIIFVFSAVLLARSSRADVLNVDTVTAARLLLAIEGVRKSESKYSKEARLVAGRIMDQYEGLPKSIQMRRRIRSQVNNLKFDSVIDQIEHVVDLLKDNGAVDQAVDLLDLGLAIDPRRVDLAYDRKVLVVENDISGFSGSYEIEVGTAVSGSSINKSGLAKRQSLVKGLLVSQVTGSRFAGSASQMNATVISQREGYSAMTVEFNQKVGSTMSKAIDHMLGYLNQRHPDLPRGVEVEFAFEEQYIPKDGPSAGVACTLMIEALLKGYDYNPKFAVTGALDVEGKVGGVGGVPAKIRGAISRQCEIVAIPSDNESVISDMIILEGVSTLAKIQVIEIEQFDDALKVAKQSEQLDENTKVALAEYKMVMDAINRPGGLNYLNNPKVQGKLRKVVELMPNHLSAKYLLLKSMNRNPKQLTLLGSVRAIDEESYAVIEEIRSGNFRNRDSLKVDKFGAAMSGLKRLRPILDKRTQACSDAIIEFTSNIRTVVNSPPKSPGTRRALGNAIDSSGDAVQSEYKKLFSREDVKKELLIDD